MFCEGHHAQKNKRRSKHMQRFFNQIFIDFPSRIDAKSPKKHENRLRAQKSTEIHAWKIIFQLKKLFARFLESLWVPRGLPGRPGSLPECLYFPINFRLRSKTGLELPREATEPPQASTWHLPGTILRRFWMNFSCAFSLAHVGKRIHFCKDVSAIFCYFPEPFP